MVGTGMPVNLDTAAIRYWLSVAAGWMALLDMAFTAGWGFGEALQELVDIFYDSNCIAFE